MEVEIAQMDSLVSVIIPFFGNTIQELRQSVSTVVSKFPVEIIVIDDHSPMAPLRTDFACPPGTELTVIRMPENGGPGLARNVGLIAARGQFIAFLDADDGFEEGYLDHAVQFLQANSDCAIVCTPAIYVDSTGQSLGARAVSPEGYYVAGDLVANKFLLQATVGRESVLRSMFFGPRHRGEDHEYLFRLASLGNLIRVTHGAKMMHRCGNAESITRSNIGRDLSERLDVIDDIWSFEESGDAYRSKLKGDRMLGLIALAVAEGNRELVRSVTKAIRMNRGRVVFCPPANIRALESLAQFFAKKQFGRPLMMFRDLAGSIEVAVEFLDLCNDFCRPAFYRLITGWFTEVRHPEAIEALNNRLAGKINLEPRSVEAGDVPQLLVDEIHAASGRPTLWAINRDQSGALIPSEPRPPLDEPQAFNLVYHSQVIVHSDGTCIAASHVARALLGASSLRPGLPPSDGKYVGGWRVSR